MAGRTFKRLQLHRLSDVTFTPTDVRGGGHSVFPDQLFCTSHQHWCVAMPTYSFCRVELICFSIWHWLLRTNEHWFGSCFNPSVGADRRWLVLDSCGQISQLGRLDKFRGLDSGTCCFWVFFFLSHRSCSKVWKLLKCCHEMSRKWLSTGCCGRTSYLGVE